MGWFRLQSSTELYPVDPREATADLAGLLGADAVVERATEKLADGEPVLALHLAEAALAGDAGHAGAKAVARDAQQALLDSGRRRQLLGRRLAPRPHRRPRHLTATTAIPKNLSDHPPPALNLGAHAPSMTETEARSLHPAGSALPRPAGPATGAGGAVTRATPSFPPAGAGSSSPLETPTTDAAA